jgi:hypothetical protein
LYSTINGFLTVAISCICKMISTQLISDQSMAWLDKIKWHHYDEGMNMVIDPATN